MATQRRIQRAPTPQPYTDPLPRFAAFHALIHAATVLNTWYTTSLEDPAHASDQDLKLFRRHIWRAWVELAEFLHEPELLPVRIILDGAIAGYLNGEHETEYTAAVLKPADHQVHPFTMDSTLIQGVSLALQQCYRLVHARDIILDGATIDESDRQDWKFEWLQEVGLGAASAAALAMRDLDRHSPFGQRLWRSLGRLGRRQGETRWYRHTVWHSEEGYDGDSDQEEGEDRKGEADGQDMEAETQGYATAAGEDTADHSNKITDETQIDAGLEETGSDNTSDTSSESSRESDSNSSREIDLRDGLAIGSFWSRLFHRS